MNEKGSSFRIRRSTVADARFVAECIFFSFEGHMRRGFFRVRLPELEEEQIISVIEQVVLRGPASAENGAFVADNFFLCEATGGGGELAGGLTTFSDHAFPRTWEVFTSYVGDSLFCLLVLTAFTSSTRLWKRGTARRRENTQRP